MSGWLEPLSLRTLASCGRGALRPHLLDRTEQTAGRSPEWAVHPARRRQPRRSQQSRVRRCKGRRHGRGPPRRVPTSGAGPTTPRSRHLELGADTKV